MREIPGISTDLRSVGFRPPPGKIEGSVRGTPKYPAVAVNSIEDESNLRTIPDRGWLTEHIQIPCG